MNAIKNYILAKYFHFSSELQEALAYLANALAPVENMSELKIVEVTISTADIINSASGKFGNTTTGQPLVAAPGTGKYIHFERATLLYDYGTAAFGGGGNVSIAATGGSDITGVFANTVITGASADVVVRFVPLSTAATAITANTGLSLKAATAFTNSGGATGSIKVRVEYRVHSI